MCKTYYDNDTGYIHECTCSRAEQLEKDFENVRDYFMGIKDMLCGKDKLDRFKLETYMDEICHKLDIKITDQDQIAI